jgi:GntR family transcriptional regulator
MSVMGTTINMAMEQADDSAARGPGYRQITEALIAEIRAGRWTLSGKLPTEHELVARFGASRNTVRESLRELETFGYIKRRRGTRSILVSTDPGDSFTNSVRSIDELLQYSRHTVSRIVSTEMVVAIGPLQQRLNAAPGSHWLRVQVLRMPTRGAMPLGFSEIFVEERYAAIADKLADDRTVYRVLEEEFGITFRRVEQVIGASAASGPIADYLRVKPGTPVLVVRTEFVTSAGDVAEVGFGHFPADRYKVEVVLERGGVDNDEEYR